jgi:hypothetical protein
MPNALAIKNTLRPSNRAEKWILNVRNKPCNNMVVRYAEKKLQVVFPKHRGGLPN